MDWRVQRVIDMLQREHGCDISTQKIARRLNLSPTHLRRLFKAETGTTIQRYVKILRLEEAKALLENPQMLVKEVVFKIGARDVSHFVREFKHSFGITPKQYRMRMFNGPKAVRGRTDDDPDG